MSEFHIHNFNDFCQGLLKAGFSMGGGNSEGIFGVVPFSWDNTPENTNIRWHTGDAETDPWEWRMRVLDERTDIAYSKLFFNKSGYITKDWYPYYLAVRRGGLTFDETYQDGAISNYAKRIYDLIAENEVLPLHSIKQFGGFSKEEKSKFDKALTELQMKMYVTMCGRQHKMSAKGQEYGWSSTVFCTVEHFFDKSVFEKAEKLSADEAREKIRKQIYLLNPQAEDKKIKKFIGG